MPKNARLTLRLQADLLDELVRHARERGVGLAPAARLLLTQSLATASRGESPLALATLVAAEHSVLLVASTMPDGERRRRATAAPAVAAAQERMTLFEGAAE